jgi:hypothetical protein
MQISAVIIFSVIIGQLLYRKFEVYRIETSFKRAVQQMNAEAADKEKQQELKDEAAAKAWAKMQEDMKDPDWWKQKDE